jgi:glycosyltransferase involved in cell wall biosynthesis
MRVADLLSRPLAMTSAVVLTATTVTNAACAGYLGLLTAAGSLRRADTCPAALPGTRFAVMIPAHNEEAVIADALQALGHLDYPRSRFDVHVVADNCTDRTAEIVREHGWNVHERHAPGHPGKGPALNWLYDRLDERGGYDAALILDADSVVDHGFLRAMDQAFGSGAVAAQGFYSVKDPNDSPSAALRYVALASRHHLRPLGRCRMGGSAGLYGNGMAFEWSLLRTRRWSDHLVEDAEYQLELLLNDRVLVNYVPDARLVAEMPSTFDASGSQHERWERGRIQLTRRYLPLLVRRSFGAHDGRRIAYLDAGADLALPPLSIVAALQMLSVAGNAMATAAGGARGRRRLAIDIASLAMIAGHVLLALRSVAAPRSVYKSLTHVPKMVLWKVRLWLRVLGPSSTVTWQRTARNADGSARTVSPS